MLFDLRQLLDDAHLVHLEGKRRAAKEFYLSVQLENSLHDMICEIKIEIKKGPLPLNLVKSPLANLFWMSVPHGYLRVRSRNIKRVRLSFDPWQFDASILFAMVLSRVEHQEWPRDLTPERVEELVAGFGSYEKMFGCIETRPSWPARPRS